MANHWYDATYKAVILRDQPALYWTLDQTTGATDQTSNGRNGTAGGSVSIGGFASSPLTDGNGCTDFNPGSTDHIKSTYAPFVNGTTLSVTGWANRDASADEDVLFASNVDYPNSPILRLEAASTTAAFFAQTTPIQWVSAWPGNTQWVHWGLIFNESSNETSLYINGAWISNVNQTEAYTTPGNFQLAAYGPTGGGQSWDGKMAHVAVFEYALHANQIQRHFVTASA